MQMVDVMSRPNSVGLFLNASSERRAEFQTDCAEMFAQLMLADHVDAAAALLGRQPSDLLVLDLNGYESLVELAGIGALIRGRNGAPTLVLCPYEHTSWLPELMTYGQFQYRICPILGDELQQAVQQALA